MTTIVSTRFEGRSTTITALLALGFAALTALSAQWYVPLWPVPVTGQTMVVLLGGATLGWAAGAGAQLVYLAVGAVGLPVFAEASAGLAILSGPTAGYLLAFPAAAALVGWLLRGRRRRFLATLWAFVLGNVVIYACGVMGLMVVLSLGFVEALEVGVLPFLVGDAMKAVLGATVWLGGRSLLDRR